MMASPIASNDVSWAVAAANRHVVEIMTGNSCSRAHACWETLRTYAELIADDVIADRTPCVAFVAAYRHVRSEYQAELAARGDDR